MILIIDTTDNVNVKICLQGKEGNLDSCIERPAARSQGERLLPAIDDLLKKSKSKIQNIEGVRVANSGGSFTSLRIGVATANALAFALGVPVVDMNGDSLVKDGLAVVQPKYGREPDIR